MARAARRAAAWRAAKRQKGKRRFCKRLRNKFICSGEKRKEEAERGRSAARGRVATGALPRVKAAAPGKQQGRQPRACPAAAPENRHRVSNVERRRVFTIMQDSRNMDLSDLIGM